MKSSRPSTAVEDRATPSKSIDDHEHDSLNQAAHKGPSEKEDHAEYPPMRIVVPVMAALYLAMFLVSLRLTDKDRIIISTAIPKITDDFHSINDIGWYGSAYVLASCSTQLIFGRLYSFFNNKTVFVASIVLFEAGSALCGAARSSIAFILGRALAGVGSAGVFAGAIVIMIPLVPLQKRPMYQSMLGAIFGVSSAVGPLVGGAFTTNSHLTWRWCFYINLPIGGASIALILLFLHLPQLPQSHSLSACEKAKRMDPLGTLLFTPSIVSLLLAIEWGGSTYAWSSSRIVALLVLAGVLFAAWVAVQAWLGSDYATVPSRIFYQRSIMAGVAYSMCIGGVLLSFSYYLAVWFQAIQGVDALQSGIRSLPFVLALVVASILAGGLTSRFGYYTPFALACSCLLAIGMGLVTLLRVDSGHSKWIGFQVVCGLGMGLGMQMSSLAAQTVLAADDVPVGASLMFFGQGLGGAVFLCITQSIFLQELLKNLANVMPDSAAKLLANTGATNIRNAVSAELLPAALLEYNKALTTAFYVPLAIASVSIVPALCFEWKSVKTARTHASKHKGADSERGGDKE
ncbi:major facilitator superfamily transporter [Ophiostoma piceae UAMH 11346]|uniref:Major facilitator superfamily transporter n=1 Tax=Ophiostoma piceae (strain UAMH 11346) TaxID=1262450 RepID=S3CCX3_OPHP1|nr:major facilitator superfamily transporter [Ophiostoma piceae UAMH 11346]